MNFFKLVLGSTDQKTTIGFELRAYPGCGPVWPLDVWTPINAFTKRALENVIDLSDEIVANLPRTTAQMRPPLDTLSDVIA